eukprot:evm.model.NODE_8418_length_3849_cov_48.781242.1
MRRALSLLALGITLALTAAQPVLTLTSIKAVASTTANKDQWSMKGFLNDPDGELVPIIEEGLTAVLLNANDDLVSTVAFTAADCKELRNDKGFVCRDTGVRLSLKRTKRVPQDAIINAQQNKNKTSSASSFFRVSGVFRRQEFEGTLSANLTAGIGNSAAVDATLFNCNMKNGTRVTKVLCK